MRSVGWNILLITFASLASARVAKKCLAPPKYPHTRLHDNFINKRTFNIGEKVLYNCAEDFTPVSRSGSGRAVQCVAEGIWTKLSLKCEKKSCGNAGEIPNGEFQYGESSFLGEKVYAVCNDGYTLKGLNYMICKNSVWTGDFPVCEEGESKCSSPAVADSVKSDGSVSVYRVGEKVTVTCSPGFQLDGAQQVTCGPGGQWQPQLPQCLPSPGKDQPVPGKDQPAPGDKVYSAGSCGVPLTTKNANLADKYLMMTSFASGDRVHYACDVGYVQAGGSRYRTCKDGQWTKLVLKCDRKPCGSAGEILNGQFTYTGVDFGDTATAVCDEGYILVGKGTRNCMDKGWDGRVPVCEAAVCPEPREVANAERTGLEEPPYTYSSVLRYKCTVGTLIGQREIWCTKDGIWSSPPPKCKEIKCQSPKMPHAYWIGAHNKWYQYGDTISIECSPGYVMTGSRMVTCGDDRRWLPALPKCRLRQWRTYRRGN